MHICCKHAIFVMGPILALRNHMSDVALCAHQGCVQMTIHGLQEFQQIAVLTCFHGKEALYCHGLTINFDSKLRVALA